MAGMSLATTAFAKAAIGSTEIKKISIGTAEIWSAINPQYDAIGSGSSAFGTPSAFNFTAAAGADVFVAVATDRTGPYTGSVTLGGTAMGLIASRANNNNNASGGLSVYRLAGGGTGAPRSVALAVSDGWTIVTAISATGVAASLTPVATSGSGTTLSHAVTLTGPLGLSFFSGGNGGGPTTQFASFSGVTNRYNLKSTGSLLAVNTVTASGTLSASTNNPWASIFVPLS
ncbi:minor tail protein [Mycobacterium phage BeesKnees]|nr:minor tail protein [Mycobacterium phage BeesKnees]